MSFFLIFSTIIIIFEKHIFFISCKLLFNLIFDKSLNENFKTI